MCLASSAHLVLSGKRHTLVETFVEDTGTRQSLQQDQLRMMPDFHRISKRFQKGVATLEDVVRVYQAVLRLPQLLELLADVHTSSSEATALLHSAFIEPLKVRLHLCPQQSQH